MRPSLLIALFVSALHLVAQQPQDLGPDELYSVSDVYINQSNKILIGTAGGLYVSSDTGATWKRPEGFRSSVYLSPQFKKNGKQKDLYMFGSTSGPDLYLSEDDGESWTLKTLFMPGLLSDVAAYGDTIFLGTFDKGLSVLKMDGSTNWFPVAVDLFSNVMITHIAFEKDLVVVSVRDDGFYISRDRGINWQRYDDLVDRPVNDILIKNNRIFISYDFDGLYVSGDQGANWVPKNGGLARTHIMDLYAEGDTLHLVTDGDNYLYRSAADEISDWTPVPSPTLPNQASEYVAGAKSLLVTGTWGSIYTSSNSGATWQASIKGIRDAFRVLSIEAADDESLWAIASHTGVYKKSSADEIFSLVVPGTNFGTAALKGDSLAVITDYRVRMYNVVTGAWGKTLTSPLYFADKLLHVDDGFFVSTKTMGVYQYTANEWRSFNAGLPELEISGFGKTGDILFAGTAQGLFKTNTGSAQWTAVPFATSGNPGVTRMIVDNTIVVINASDHNTYLSTDGGATWKRIEELQNAFAYSMYVSGDSIFIGEFQTLAYSLDRGASWQQSNVGDHFIDAMLIDKDKLYIGTLEDGIKEIALQNDQTITFEVSDKYVGDNQFALNAVTTSGLPVVWSSSDPSILSINGSGVARPLKAGSVTIKATQSGNLFFKSAEAEKTIMISDPPPIVTALGESPDAPFSVYPIPCKDLLYLAHNTATDGAWSIKTLDGRTADISSRIEGDHVIVDFSQCHAGLYIVQYSRGKSVWRKKIIKE